MDRHPDDSIQPCTREDVDRTLRRTFYNTLLTLRARRPNEVRDTIAEAWRIATGAAAASIWFYNRYTETFELGGFAAPNQDEVKQFLVAQSPDFNGSVLYYVQKTGAPEFVPDATNWTRQDESKTYHVVLHQEMSKAELPTAAFIPIKNNHDHEESECPECWHMDGVVALYFSGRDQGDGRWIMPSHPDAEVFEPEVAESLTLMQRLTGLAIAKLRLRQQAEIGDKLAHLAAQHLVRWKDDPRAVRREYLGDICDLLEQELDITAASFWWEVPFGSSLSCLHAKRGLLRTSDKKLLSANVQIEDCTYTEADDWNDTDERRSALTYRVFRTGRQELWLPGTSADNEPKYHDVGSGDPLALSPALYMPISELSSTTDGEQPGALGVIRCAHVRGYANHNIRPFDIVEVRMVEFIAHQIMPVLRSLAARILREDAISIIKHDMGISLRQMSDLIYEIVRAQPNPSDNLALNLANLEECVMSASGLSERLARDVESKIEFRPSKTDIGRDIMPRLKRLLTPYARFERHASIWFDGFEKLPPLNIDRGLVERAIYNLIINAIKYGARNQTIHVDASITPDGYAVDVSNEGQGIRDEDEKNIGKIYFRSKYIRGEGSGLGLHIVGLIMKKHQGEMKLLSLRDPTVFRLLFPRQRAAMPLGRSSG